ncbi:PREDICTED: uncharacterized protein LOC108555364 isoform X1 [Eufriesea mexicana]|uniref:uncharacterized protein LOC108555364 isoform X1 n=1 Tax=Eufriesea mexicana TaxID=516756 RepID=UPI00083C47E8|nr:PREDICTED: uncharacterized protein LOC108555364 isoform X1 [Eufriesea mexicana]
MKMFDMKLVILSMLVLLVGVLARPESEVEPPAVSPSGPASEGSEVGGNVEPSPPPEETPVTEGGVRRKRSNSGGLTEMLALLPNEVEALGQTILTFIEKLYGDVQSNPVDLILGTLQDLKDNPLNDILTNIPIIGNVVELLEGLLQVPADILANVLKVVVSLVQSLLGGILGITPSSSTESSMTTFSS